MRAGAALVAILAVTHSAAAQDQRSTVTFKVGETRQIAIFGGHRSDCVTSIPPDALQLVQPPHLGTVSQRLGVPYVVRESISNTCIGAHLVGSAIDYTARQPGQDTVVLDAKFRNGSRRWVFTINVEP